jgi:Na+/melibiose symporter-like transporter
MKGWRIFLYAIAIWPMTIGQQPLMLVAPYYAFAFGMSLTVLGAWMTAGRIFDVFVDIGVAYFSDKYRTNLGRKPWVVVGLLFFIPSMWLLFVPPADGMTMNRYIIGIFCFFLSWTTGFIPYLVHGTELTNDPAKRAAINVIQGAGNSLALVASYAFPLVLLMPSFEPQRQAIGAKLASAEWSPIANLGGMLQAPLAPDVSLYGLTMLAIVLATTIITPILLGGYAFFVPDETRDLPMEKGGSAMAAFRNPVFLRFSLGYLALASAYFIALFLLPLQLNFRFEAADQLLPLSLAMTIAQIAVAPIWYLLIAKLERHKTLVLAAAMQGLSLLLFLLTPTGSMPMLMASYIAFGLTGQTLMMLPFLIASDAADYSRWKTGLDSRAMHISLVSLLIKAGSISGALFLSLAGILGVGDAQLANRATTVAHLNWLTFIIPIILLLLGSALVWKFPITRARQQALQRRIAARSALATKFTGLNRPAKEGLPDE